VTRSTTRSRRIGSTGSPRPFFREVGALARTIGGEIGGTDALPTERERKYLLRHVPPLARAAPSVRIDQGWLPGQVLRERIRRVEDAGGVRFYRAVKLGSGVERTEIEEACTEEVFKALWPLTEGCRVSKRRYRVEEAEGFVWEVDEFTDRDLVLAEVELTTAVHEPPAPRWLGSALVREVTDEVAYTNLSLAESGKAEAVPGR
jgi:CYTH domain-containing protein